MERPNRDVPRDIQEEARSIELSGLVALRGKEFSTARQLFQNQYDLYFNAQSRVGRPIHKGAPLHNLGLALLYLEDVDKSIYHFLLAYIEDTLNANFDSEDEADRSPAARMLRDVFLLKLKILGKIKEASFKIKKDGLWNKARDPEKILNNVAKSLMVNIDELSGLCGRIPKIGKMVVGFPQPRELRVFIGTNYDVNIGVIPLVKEGIYRKNLTANRSYVPIAALDVFVPPNATHDISLLLLHTCWFAIIDVSHPGGQFVEIERIGDYGIPRENVLLVRHAAKPIDPKKPPHVSEMISTLGYPIEYYYDPRELITLTHNFLP